jgi:hypothetical protein
MTRLAALAVVLAGLPAGRAQVVDLGWDNPRGTLTLSSAARAAFLARLASWGTDTLESYAAFAPDPTLRFGSTGLTAATDVDFVVSFASLAISGSNTLLDRADGGDVFTFNRPISAFGMYVVQAGDGTNVNQFTVRLENTLTGASRDVVLGTFGPGAAFDNAFYFGITDPRRFDRVTIFESIDANDGTLYDDITAGWVDVIAAPSPPSAAAVAPVLNPEPGSLALAFAAAAGLAARRAPGRRR